MIKVFELWRRSLTIFFSLYVFYCWASETWNLCIVSGEIHQFVRPKMRSLLLENKINHVLDFVVVWTSFPVFKKPKRNILLVTLSLVLHKMSDACPFPYSSSIFYDILHMLVAMHMTHAPIWAVNTIDSGPHLPGSRPQYAARRMSKMKEDRAKCRLFTQLPSPVSWHRA
jgi:hypothetical protein